MAEVKDQTAINPADEQDTKTAETAKAAKTGEEKSVGIDYEAIAAKQQNQINALIKQNKETAKAANEKITALEEKVSNFQANTAEENALLGQKINDVAQGKEAVAAYDPFDDKIIYNVANADAGITTVMCGDEVKGIIGSIDKHLIVKLVKGEKTVEKHPYTITLLEKDEVKE